MKRLGLAIVVCSLVASQLMGIEATLLAPTAFARSTQRPAPLARSFRAPEDGLARLVVINGGGG